MSPDASLLRARYLGYERFFDGRRYDYVDGWVRDGAFECDVHYRVWCLRALWGADSRINKRRVTMIYSLWGAARTPPDNRFVLNSRRPFSKSGAQPGTLYLVSWCSFLKYLKGACIHRMSASGCSG